jgi:hypothetical protein
MGKDYNYKNYFSISDAMYVSNTIMPGDKFTLLDYNLLCLIKSFADAKQNFYMTNDQLAKLFLSSERTIRYSISRLCNSKLISKENIDNNRLKGRYLIYQEKNVKAFIQRMQFESPGRFCHESAATVADNKNKSL